MNKMIQDSQDFLSIKIRCRRERLRYNQEKSCESCPIQLYGLSAILQFRYLPLPKNQHYQFF